MKTTELTTAVKEKMKKAFNECHKAVMACTDETGRKRCELFRELPDKRVSTLLPSRRHVQLTLRGAIQDYPDYYRVITSPIALSHLRKRISSYHYKTVTQFRDDARLMFNNARTYNQEGSWVYIDAVEMEKVFDATYARVTVGSGLPGAEPAPALPLTLAGASSADIMVGGMDEALTPMDDDDSRPPPKTKNGRKQIVSDDEFMSPSDDD